MELQFKGTSEKDSSLDYMVLQGVRFAFRIHQVRHKLQFFLAFLLQRKDFDYGKCVYVQFAGGFDAETMHAFEELRDLAVVLSKNGD